MPNSGVSASIMTISAPAFHAIVWPMLTRLMSVMAEPDVINGAKEPRRLPPPVALRMAVLYRQVEDTVRLKGEKVALLQARKHAAWYVRGIRGASDFRREAGTLRTLSDLEAFCARVVAASEAAGDSPAADWIPPEI